MESSDYLTGLWKPTRTLQNGRAVNLTGGGSSHIGRLENATQMGLSTSLVYIMLFLILVLSRMQKKYIYIINFFCHYYKVKAADEQGPTFFGETKTAQTMAEEPRSRNHGLWYSRTES